MTNHDHDLCYGWKKWKILILIDNIYYIWSGNRELNKWIEKCNRSVPLPGQGLSVNKERLPFADKQLNESESGPDSSFSISTSNFISPTNLGRMTKNYLNLMIPIETTRKQRLSSILFTRMRGRKKSSQIQLCLPHHIKKEHQSSNRKEEERILFYSALNWVFVYLSEIYTTSKFSLIFNFSLKVAQFHTKRIYLHNVKCNKSWKLDTFSQSSVRTSPERGGGVICRFSISGHQCSQQLDETQRRLWLCSGHTWDTWTILSSRGQDCDTWHVAWTSVPVTRGKVVTELSRAGGQSSAWSPVSAVHGLRWPLAGPPMAHNDLFMLWRL